MPKRKKPALDNLTPFICETVHEISPIAEATFRDYADAAGDAIDPSACAVDIAMSLEDAVDSFSQHDIGSDEPRRERRAALLRVASRALLLLALDEFERGGRACARDAKALTPTGHVKPARTRKG